MGGTSSLNGEYTQIHQTSSNNFTDTGLSGLTGYFYRVTAKTTLCDVSTPSTPVGATTQ